MTTSAAPSTVLRMTVNGRPVEVSIPPDRSLLDVLREDLRLTAAKKGCDIGVCGSCTVIVDGKALNSCVEKATACEGKAVETLEGIARDGELHPLQKAFIACQGFQCGICTPGFVMRAKALLDRKPNPTRAEIEHELRGNICRCTGYEQLIESVQVAAGQVAPEAAGAGHYRTVRVAPDIPSETPWKGWEFKVIGKGRDRIESISRVTGSAKYTADHFIDGMVHGATVRSPHPHALVKSIDTAEAERAPGVVRVLTWKDIPGENAYGKKVRDQQVFARHKVRHAGEAIALVVAETRKEAVAAAALVRVEYEPLPVVSDPEAAMAPDSAKVHEKGNVLFHYHLEKGDCARGFADADVVVEGRYATQPQDHAPLESEAAIAFHGEDGKLTVVSPGQSVFFDRLNIIRALGVPKEDVRCIQPAIGAAYGKREDIYAQIHAALATFVTGRPCKIEWTREETLLVTTKRTQQRTWIRVGVKKDGRITAFEARVVGDSGAYASWSPNIMRKAGVLVAGPYDIPNVRVDSYAVYTNNPMTGATRGFGAAETNFCSESHYDVVAERIGMDPLEFRLKNALRRGARTSTDAPIDHFVPLEACLHEAARELDWEARRRAPKEVSPGVRRGIGLAAVWYGIGFGGAIADSPECIAEIGDDGEVTIYVGTVDYGNGSNTTFVMMAAEVTGADPARVRIVNADSDRTQNCGSTVATKQTFTTGNAVVRACLPIRRDLLEIAGKLLGAEPSACDLGFGWAYVKADRARRVPIADCARRFREFGRPRRRSGIFNAAALTTPLDSKTGTGKAWFPMAYGAQVAEVEVDLKKGKVRVKEIAAAHYVGRSINPTAVRGQIVGGVSFGVGFALFEDAQYENGVPRALNFDRYKLMRSNDYPIVRAIAVECDEAAGPFGAIGIGEPPTIPTAAAIANAVYDAVGVRVSDLPITPEKVKAGLAKLGLSLE